MPSAGESAGARPCAGLYALLVRDHVVKGNALHYSAAGSYHLDQRYDIADLNDQRCPRRHKLASPTVYIGHDRLAPDQVSLFAVKRTFNKILAN